MLSLNTTLRTLASRLGIGAHSNSTPPIATTTAALPNADEVFMASLSGLSPEEQQKRIKAREWYKRLARRQGIMEIEDDAERIERSGSWSPEP